MPTFRYVATMQGDENPATIGGKADADSPDALKAKLKAVGIDLTSWEMLAVPATTDADLERIVENIQYIGIVQLSDLILQQAIQAGASDIHLDPNGEGGVVRFRIDGLLVKKLVLPNSVFQPLSSRLKLLAKINFNDSPQEGAISYRFEDRDYDLRVSAVMTIRGESIVSRIFPGLLSKDWSFEKIGLGGIPDAKALIGLPQGLILFAGPTGSGKTSVMYAALQEFDLEKLNVVMVADELSYRIEGVNQTMPASSVAQAVRDLMARDPDILAIGELKRKEDVEAALEAVSTGHLVLGVLHANDAAHAIERLRAMGVSQDALASGLSGILSSRLVRRICQECKASYSPDPIKLRELGISEDETTFHRGAGCDNCHQTGYKGRMGLFEVVTIDEELSRSIRVGFSSDDLRSAFAAKGFVNARSMGARLALSGETTVEEVLRVTG